MGDQVSALFVPRFAGKDHAKVAIHAARELLHATGHEDPIGPWLPVGVGLHTDPAYVGVVGSKDGVNEIAVLGSTVNLAARLSSQASTGEMHISDTAVKSAGLDTSRMISRVLNLKGISNPMEVVQVSRKSEDVPPVVEQAIKIGAKIVWMQKGIINEEAARTAESAGLKVVMNRCMMETHQRLLGDKFKI